MTTGPTDRPIAPREPEARQAAAPKRTQAATALKPDLTTHHAEPHRAVRVNPPNRPPTSPPHPAPPRHRSSPLDAPWPRLDPTSTAFDDLTVQTQHAILHLIQHVVEKEKALETLAGRQQADKAHYETSLAHMKAEQAHVVQDFFALRKRYRLCLHFLKKYRHGHGRDAAQTRDVSSPGKTDAVVAPSEAVPMTSTATSPRKPMDPSTPEPGSTARASSVPPPAIWTTLQAELRDLKQTVLDQVAPTRNAPVIPPTDTAQSPMTKAQLAGLREDLQRLKQDIVDHVMPVLELSDHVSPRKEAAAHVEGDRTASASVSDAATMTQPPSPPHHLRKQEEMRRDRSLDPSQRHNAQQEERQRELELNLSEHLNRPSRGRRSTHASMSTGTATPSTSNPSLTMRRFVAPRSYRAMTQAEEAHAVLDPVPHVSRETLPSLSRKAPSPSSRASSVHALPDPVAAALPRSYRAATQAASSEEDDAAVLAVLEQVSHAALARLPSPCVMPRKPRRRPLSSRTSRDPTPAYAPTPSPLPVWGPKAATPLPSHPIRHDRSFASVVAEEASVLSDAMTLDEALLATQLNVFS